MKVGRSVGVVLGTAVELTVGMPLGTAVGSAVGTQVGMALGSPVGMSGATFCADDHAHVHTHALDKYAYACPYKRT